MHWRCRGWTSVSSTAIARSNYCCCLWLRGLTHSDSGPLEVFCIHEVYPYPAEHPGGSVSSFTIIVPVIFHGPLHCFALFVRLVLLPLFFFFVDYYYLLGFLFFLFIILPFSSTTIILTHHSILSLHMVWGVSHLWRCWFPTHTPHLCLVYPTGVSDHPRPRTGIPITLLPPPPGVVHSV